jgi:hypothetical protein
MQEQLTVLRARLTPLISGVLEGHGLSERISAEPFVDAVVLGLISREKQIFLNTRERLIREANGAPRCWVCELLIPMNAPEDSYACFSVDHVKERRVGGDWHGSENLRPAHRLCNAIRSNSPRPRTLRRYVAFLRELAGAEGQESVDEHLSVAG